MQVAILGAGFCGLATAWHLAQNGQHQVVLFDPLGIGKGASGVAAGLLHPYAGARSKLNWRGLEGIAATLDLVKVAESFLGFSVISRSGMQRMALFPQQDADFSQCSQEYSDVHWRSIEECQQAVPGLNAFPGIYIENAYVVDCEKYLEGLWLACAASGVQFRQQSVHSLKELDAFDHVVVAMGAASNALPELSHIRITPIKGQVLTLSWPNIPILPFPISSQAYLLMHPRENACIAGATYERDFNDEKPDLEVAKKEILPKINAFYPKLENASIISCRAGIRASTDKHLPLMLNVGKGRWLLTGMGSKGLLYHALYAKDLASLLVKQSLPATHSSLPTHEPRQQN